MGVTENYSRTSTMRHLRLLLLLLIIIMLALALAQPCLVDGRPLGRPEAKTTSESTDHNHPEAVDHGGESETIGQASFSKPSNNVGGRVLVRDQVFTTLASGPSRKGSGH
jgi:hypothetical protein